MILRKKRGMSRAGRRGMAFLLSAAMVFTVPAFSFADTVRNYADGTYRGSGRGYQSDIVLDVTVSDGKISKIETISQDETPSYWKDASAIFDDIIEKGDADVSAVSGATRSCDGIKAAVNKALDDAAQAWADKDETTVFSSGSGTERDPYIINTASQLANFAKSVDGGNNYQGKFIKLGADIDISNIENWNPIGAEGTSKDNADSIFDGSFDGGGHAVIGMKISGSFDGEANVGLFSSLGDDAVVSNIDIKGVSVNITGSDMLRAGAVAGDIAATLIDNCRADGSIEVSTDAPKLVFGGGMVGRAGKDAEIINCVSDVDIKTISRGGSNSAYAGGMAGTTGNNSLIANCANFGDLSAESPKSTNFGGMAGGIAAMHAGKMYNCYSTGNVTFGNGGSKHKWGGAIAGEFTTSGMTRTSNNEYVYPDKGALRAYCYYADDIELTENVYSDASTIGSSNKISPVNAAGTGSSIAYDKVFTATAMTKSAISDKSFADTLNANILDITKLFKVYDINNVTLKEWAVENGRAVLSDTDWVNGEIDASIFESGNGTQADPYIIHNESQLRAFASSMNDKIDYTDKYIMLDADIQAAAGSWTPIGGSEYLFNGTFDGAGHSISGLTLGAKDAPYALDSENIYVGLFGIVGPQSVIKNVDLKDVSFHASYAATAYIGGIAGVMQGSTTGGNFTGAVIDGCSVSGEMSLIADKGNQFVGGIVGMQYKGAIINSSSAVDASCTVKAGDLAEAGGIVALNNRGMIANCKSESNVYGSGNRENGNEGMAVVSSLAACNAGMLVNCYASGDITTAEHSVYAGMVSGWVTGIGKSYKCWYDLGSKMTLKAGTSEPQIVDPVESIGTKVASGVNDEGDAYTGGLVDAMTGVKAEDYAKVADAMNAVFEAFPADIAVYGLSQTALKKWTYDNDNKLTFADESASAVYVQPECEKYVRPELALKDGVWYGRSDDKSSVVKITISNGAVTAEEVVSGAAEGEAYDSALEKAKYKAKYGDTSDYAAADPSRFAGGAGTEASPYLISNEAQLRYLSSSINSDVDWSGVYFKQTADITLTSGDWKPIGWSINGEVNGAQKAICAYPFRGSYDGGGFSITGLTIGSKAAPADQTTSGLFGLVAGEYSSNSKPDGTEQVVDIRNVHLKDVNINISTRYQTYTAGLVGCAQNGIYIDNCSVTGSINVKTEESFARAGGLAGNILRGAVTNSWTDAAVNAETDTSHVYAGGLYAMDNRVTTVNCYALGNVTGNSTNNNKVHIGGIVGQAGGIHINCYAAGDVISLKTTSDVGILSGRAAGINVDYDCYYNSEAALKQGDTTVSPAVASGVVVTNATVENVAGKTAAELKSADFAALLNSNITAENLKAAVDFVNAAIADPASGLTQQNYFQNNKLLEWKLEDNVVGFVSSLSGSGGSGSSGGGSGSGSSGGSGSSTTTPSTPSTPAAGGSSFSDVPAGAYYKDAVDWAVEKNITSGKTANLFAPDDSCTRAQAVTFLWRAAGSPEPASAQNSFTDVSQNAYYYKAVLWAVEKGITAGTSASTFSPEKTISRAEMATFLWRYAETPAAQSAAGFLDVDAAAYYHDAVAWAASNGITSGTSSSTFDPDGNCTRGQIVTFLYRYMK